MAPSRPAAEPARRPFRCGPCLCRWFGDRGAEHEGRDEIPEGCPGDRAEGVSEREWKRRGDGIGRIMPAVGKFEVRYDDASEEAEAIHGRNPRSYESENTWRSGGIGGGLARF